MALRLVFAGTPEFAATILEHLLEAGVRPLRVLTQPDRPQGRGRKLTASPVKRLAMAAGIEVQQPSTLNRHKPEGEIALASILAEPFDVLLVAAYGLMIPRSLLEHPRFGAVNVHASLLPRWRGAAPVEYAIMANDKTTGVTLMQMDVGLDTGPVLISRAWPISVSATGPALTAELAELGGRLLVELLPNMDRLQAQSQNEAQATHAPKLRAGDAIIDWSRSATAIHNQVRALTNRLTAETTLLADSTAIRLRILESEILAIPTTQSAGTILESSAREVIPVACGEGVIGLQRIQLNIGKGLPLSAAEARNGFGKLLAPGRVLGEMAR